jgi:hypothetical protein
MAKRLKTISINLRLPLDLHKRLVGAAASSSPVSSLNSEILSRLFESFQAEEMVAGFKTRLSKLEAETQARMGEVEARAEQMSQNLHEMLTRIQQLTQRVKGGLEDAEK